MIRPSLTIPRLAGALYLGTIVCGLFAEAIARGPLVDGSDAASTTRAILAHQALFRAGIAADLAMLSCYVAVTALFHDMFRAVNRRLSGMAAIFSVIGIAVLAVDTMLPLGTLRVLGESNVLASIDTVQRDGEALLLLKCHGDGYDVSLVFFGIYCLLLGWLIWNSTLLPRTIAALMGFAGLCYLVNSIADLAVPAFARILSPHIMDPTLIGESALALWLMVRGTRNDPTQSKTGSESDIDLKS